MKARQGVELQFGFPVAAHPRLAPWDPAAVAANKPRMSNQHHGNMTRCEITTGIGLVLKLFWTSLEVFGQGSLEARAGIEPALTDLQSAT